MSVQKGHTQLNKKQEKREREALSMLCFNHLSSLSWEIPFVQLFFMVGSLPVCSPSGCLLSVVFCG